MDKKYWENYYSLPDSTPNVPSLFAKFVLEHCLNEKDSIIELGCGNGRDCIFFARHNIKVYAVDQSEKEILALSKENFLDNLTFKAADFSKLPDGNPYEAVYSRFTLHSISEDEESRVVSWTARNLKPGGKFIIEARGKKNELYKKGEAVSGENDAYVYNHHYRRFIDKDNLDKKIIDSGLKIESSEEKTGFAPFEDTDYHFIRIIASK